MLKRWQAGKDALDRPDDMMREHVSGGNSQRRKADREWDERYRESRSAPKPAATVKREASAVKQERTTGLNQGGNRFEAKQLSWDEYNALNPRQRAAVDANTEILNAVNADKEAVRANPALAGDDQYKASVEGMFGQEGGSNTYAPRTVAALEGLGIQGKKTYDLDNYLNLSSLVTDKDLDYLTPEALQATPAGQSQVVRENNARNFSSKATSTLASTLAAGQGLLEALRAGGNTTLGETPGSKLGFGASERDAGISALFDAMAQRGSSATTEEAADALSSFGQEFGLGQEEIVGYFEQRLKQLEYDGAAGGDITAFMDAAEFRNRYYTGGI